jgi:uncharacterized protein (DUF1778 family)
MPPSARRKNVATPLRRDAVVNVRLARRTKDLIDSAALAAGKSRSEFMLESARNNAMDVLLGQRFFALDAKQFKAFEAALARPPAPNRKLKALLAAKAPWEL